MLNILVDESYAFDFISILDVKLRRFPYVKQVNDQRDIIVNSLKMQLGESLMNEILSSDEYKACIDANEIMFDLVDKAKKDEVTAQDVDYGNYRRCEAKKRLQMKFFNSGNVEIKTGYDKYERKY